ncbi:MAG: hypothetical protein II965_09405 [Pyramidobacter sp.]|nr:hypothetical protein [Pyramidobacter sp.]
MLTILPRSPLVVPSVLIQPAFDRSLRARATFSRFWPSSSASSSMTITPPVRDACQRNRIIHTNLLIVRGFIAPYQTSSAGSISGALAAAGAAGLSAVTGAAFSAAGSSELMLTICASAASTSLPSWNGFFFLDMCGSFLGKH